MSSIADRMFSYSTLDIQNDLDHLTVKKHKPTFYNTADFLAYKRRRLTITFNGNSTQIHEATPAIRDQPPIKSDHTLPLWLPRRLVLDSPTPEKWKTKYYNNSNYYCNYYYYTTPLPLLLLQLQQTLRLAYLRVRRPPIHISVSSIWHVVLAMKARCAAETARLRQVWSPQFDSSYVNNIGVISSLVLRHCSNSSSARSWNSLRMTTTTTTTTTIVVVVAVVVVALKSSPSWSCTPCISANKFLMSDFYVNTVFFSFWFFISSNLPSFTPHTECFLK